MPAPVSTADEFLVRYGVVSPGSSLDQEPLVPGIQLKGAAPFGQAERDFLGLPASERFQALQHLLRGASHRTFLRRVFLGWEGLPRVSCDPLFKEWRPSPQLLQLASAGLDDSWEARLMVLKESFIWREFRIAIDRCLREDVITASAATRMLLIEPEVERTFATLYRSRSDLFDSDEDGHFDHEDDFPLDARFHTDFDGDNIPDALDRYPKDSMRWHNLRNGESRDLHLPTGEGVFKVTRERDDLVLEVSLWATAEEGRPLSSEKKALIEGNLEGFYNKRFPKGVRLNVSWVDGPSAAALRVRVLSTGRGSTPWEWYLEGDLGKHSTTVAHEFGHLLGWPDRYGRKSHGWEKDWDHMTHSGRRFLIEPRDIMTDPSTEEAKVLEADLMPLLAVIVYGNTARRADLIGNAAYVMINYERSLADLPNGLSPEPSRRFYQGVANLDVATWGLPERLLAEKGRALWDLAKAERNPNRARILYESAAAVYRQGLEYTSLTPEVWNNLAHIYHSLMRISESPEDKKRYIQLVGETSREAISLGNRYAFYQTRISTLNDWATFVENDVDAIGMLDAALGLIDRAQRQHEKARADEAFLEYQRAAAFYEKGRRTQAKQEQVHLIALARSAIERCLKKDPNYSGAADLKRTIEDAEEWSLSSKGCSGCACVPTR